MRGFGLAEPVHLRGPIGRVVIVQRAEVVEACARALQILHADEDVDDRLSFESRYRSAADVVNAAHDPVSDGGFQRLPLFLKLRRPTRIVGRESDSFGHLSEYPRGVQSGGPLRRSRERNARTRASRLWAGAAGDYRLQRRRRSARGPIPGNPQRSNPLAACAAARYRAAAARPVRTASAELSSASTTVETDNRKPPQPSKIIADERVTFPRAYR